LIPPAICPIFLLSAEKKERWPMETFSRLFGSLLAFVYHCFDRVVIHGYLSGLSRPHQLDYFFRRVVGVPVITKEVLSRRTEDYQQWVEGFARNHKIPIEWGEKSVRKEDHVLPWLRRMERRDCYGVYFIFKSMEVARTFRSCEPKRNTTDDPNFRVLSPQRSRFTHYYFYIRDKVLGPMVMRMGSFLPFQAAYYLNGHSFIEQQLKQRSIAFKKDDNAFLSVSDPVELQAAADRFSPDIIRAQLDYWTFLLGPKFSKGERGAMNLSRFYAINQIEYCLNFIFKRHFPIHKIFERSCELGLWRLTAHNISEIFGFRRTRKLRGKLYTTIQQIEHCHHIFRAYCKNAMLKQYEKLLRFLRNEICSNQLSNFRLKKGLDNLPHIRKTFSAITDRFATYQAQWLNVHVDFPLLQRIALPIQIDSRRFPGIKIQDTRMIRLMEVLLHGGTRITGWTSRQIHEAVLASYRIPVSQYGLNQLRYDLRKLKAHSLLEREKRRYAYRLSHKGVRVALLVVLIHKRLFGPLSNSLFHHRPNIEHIPDSPLEAAYHKADAAIQNVIDLLEAA
jgi:hypothetical protein